MKKIYTLFLLLVIFFLPVRLYAANHPVRTAAAGVTLAEREENEIEHEEEGQREDNITEIMPPERSPLETNTPTVTTDTDQSPQTAAVTDTDQIQPATVSASFPWPWVVTRAAGISSFILLALTTIIGISITTGLMFRFFSPATAWSIHRAIGSMLLVAVLLHVGSLFFDSFLNMGFADILIPFASFFRTTLVALGTIGFYLLLAILGTSLYTMTKYAKFWRFLHYFGFVMFVLLFLHGVLIGTDTREWWMKIIYWTSALAVTSFGVYRVVWKLRKPVV
ncbi:MAG: ferric reductase-like transmembrane domain-containing protein [Patescibacteria group bacterium]